MSIWDDTNSITLAGSLYTDINSINNNNITLNTSQLPLSFDEGIHKGVITLDGEDLDAELIAKLRALLDVIEQLDDDNELKTLFNTQLAFNKLTR